MLRLALKTFSYLAICWGVVAATAIAQQIQPAPIEVAPIQGGTSIAPTPLAAPERIVAPSIGASSIGNRPAIEKPARIGGQGIQVPKIEVPKINVQSIGGNRRNTSLGGDGQGFDYNRYNRFGSQASGSPVAAAKRSFYPESDERVDSVQILLPSLDGYETLNGYQFAPDISQDEFIWLPIGSR